jgi:hypothetical protein
MLEKDAFPAVFQWNAKKRLNHLFIKNLPLFPKFDSRAFSDEKAFFNTQ